MASDLPGRLAEAERAAGRRDWTGAERALRAAIGSVEGVDRPTAAVLKRNLAVVLANRGGEAGGRAMEMIGMAAQLGTEDHRREVDRRTKTFLEQREVRGMLWILLFTFLGLTLLGMFVSGDESWPTLGEAPATRISLAAGVAVILTWPFSSGVAWVVDWFTRTMDVTRFSRPPRCAVCPSDSSYRADVPGHGERSLCGRHASELESILNALPAPVGTRVLLERARADLEESMRLDPSLEGVKENLAEVNGILERLLPEPKRRRRSKR